MTSEPIQILTLILYGDEARRAWRVRYTILRPHVDHPRSVDICWALTWLAWGMDRVIRG